ncbi:MAG: GAF domain-containing protein, partial [Gammaproteobacteria bacterium]|nr:GAF domain-containing protein [Gammaproteobacteria bacterium]
MPFIDSIQDLVAATDSPVTDTRAMEILEDAMDAFLHAVDAADAVLLVRDEDSNDLVFVLVRGTLPAQSLRWQRIPATHGIAGWVFMNQRPAIINNTQADDRFRPWIIGEDAIPAATSLAAPIIHDNRVLGVIEVLNKHKGQHFSVADETLLTLMCR